MRTFVIAVVGLAMLVAVLFLLPVVPESPWIFECAPESSCPGGGQPNQAQYLAHVSVTHYYLGVGGRLVFGGHFQVAYLPGWTCYQTSAEVTMTSTNGNVTTTKVLLMPGGTCKDHVISIT